MPSYTDHDSGGASTDELFALLGVARRRNVLFCLRAHRRPMTFAELTEAVAEREGESLDPAEELTNHPVATTLYHVHLPKLSEAGLIERRGDGTIAYDVSVEADESLLELVERIDSASS